MRYKLCRPLLALLLAILPFGGLRAAPPLPTVSYVDLPRYCGRWVEVARLPNSFQRADERASADYALLSGQRLSVKNTAERPDGTRHSIQGVAEVVPESRNARLRVRLAGAPGLFPVSKKGNYWIIALDEARYRFAMVGEPDRRYLWILARTPSLDPDELARLIARAHTLGFPTEKLIRDPRKPKG
jgi:apolipoprotein D and lipocalin family protein